MRQLFSLLFCLPLLALSGVACNTSIELDNRPCISQEDCIAGYECMRLPGDPQSRCLKTDLGCSSDADCGTQCCNDTTLSCEPCGTEPPVSDEPTPNVTPATPRPTPTTPVTQPPTPVATCTMDNDMDGYCSTFAGGNDCNDGDENIHPDATENCTDNIDNNCNQETDCRDAACTGETRDCSNDCGSGVETCQPGGDWGACSAPEQVPENADGVCGDGRDNDCDGDMDCADIDCEGQGCGTNSVCVSGSCECAGGETATGEQSCGDGEDNDCDGRVDCADPDCDGDDCGPGICEGLTCVCPAGSETETSCDDGVDDDCDGDFDCADSDCATGVSCGPSGATCQAGACSCPGGEEVETSCGDNIDNDCDGLTDCEDSGCDALSCGDNGQACSGNTCVCPLAEDVTGEQSCADGLDNDCDGQTDCADGADCQGDACDEMGRSCDVMMCVCPGGEDATGGETTCDDAQDNDCDLDFDCADSDCEGQACAPGGAVCSGGECVCPGGVDTELGACGDGVDNDCDGQMDCEDPDCDRQTCVGEGECFRGVCESEPIVEATCNDGEDNDDNGLTDCFDDWCISGAQTCDPQNMGRDLGHVCRSINGVRLCVCRFGQPRETSCANRTDDDCDGLLDCEDPDCDGSLCGHPSAGLICQNDTCFCTNGEQGTETICDDGIDNDCDIFSDCNDPDCRGVGTCP